MEDLASLHSRGSDVLSFMLSVVLYVLHTLDYVSNWCFVLT